MGGHADDVCHDGNQAQPQNSILAAVDIRDDGNDWTNGDGGHTLSLDYPSLQRGSIQLRRRIASTEGGRHREEGVVELSKGDHCQDDGSLEGYPLLVFGILAHRVLHCQGVPRPVHRVGELMPP